jgi:hypothetical protein
VAHGVPATGLSPRPIGLTPRDGQRGRPRPGAPPDPVVASSDGALASPGAARQARLERHRWGILATNARDTPHRPAQALCAGDNGQGPAARGVRVRNAPGVLAASRALNKPARSLALCLGRTGGWLGSAAWASRLRQARQDHGAIWPQHTGQPGQHPTARWVVHDVVGMPRLRIPHPWPMVVNRTAAPQPRLQRLGARQAGCSRGIVTNINASVRNVGDSWRTEETSLTLGLDYFTIATDEPQLPAWRATRQARQA